MNTFAPPGADAVRYLNTFLTAHAARLRAALAEKDRGASAVELLQLLVRAHDHRQRLLDDVELRTRDGEVGFGVGCERKTVALIAGMNGEPLLLFCHPGRVRLQEKEGVKIHA